MSHPVISGAVVDAEGKAVADARVFFSDGPGSWPDIAVLTDEAGRFSLAAPSTGSYTLSCAAEDLAPAETVVEVKTSGATVELQLGE